MLWRFSILVSALVLSACATRQTAEGTAGSQAPVAQVRLMESTLRDLGKDATIQIYPGAGHAFANPSGQAYKADVAGDAWVRTTAHFGRHLR
ncbi:MAG TPA: dienelactone hydrolase family protein [Longimicrobium sp.]|jgi:carboxymethylenebutenolidase|nr:dienelactone hydrolase family protein [Longimicrobium sp.]